MNTSVNRFFEGIKGKTVAFIGIGTSNLPLIKLFADKGAKVKALDRKDFEALGENGVLAKEYGAELILGDCYLDNIDADIVFRSPGTRFSLSCVRARQLPSQAPTARPPQRRSFPSS